MTDFTGNYSNDAEWNIGRSIAGAERDRAVMEQAKIALINSRSCLKALGGDPRSAIALHGSDAGDVTQAAMLDEIDAALSAYQALEKGE